MTTSERVIQKSVENALNRLADGGWWSRPDMFRHPQLVETTNAPRWQQHLLIYMQGQGWLARQGSRGAVRYQVVPGAQQALRALATDDLALAGVLFPRFARVQVDELPVLDAEGAGPEDDAQVSEPSAQGVPSMDERVNVLLQATAGVIERLNRLDDAIMRIDRNVSLLVTDLRGEPGEPSVSNPAGRG